MYCTQKPNQLIRANPMKSAPNLLRLAVTFRVRSGRETERAVYIGARMKTLLALLLVPLLTATSAAPKNPVRWTVVGGNGPRTVAPGQTVRIALEADIARGWHIYSMSTLR